jgi:hypothetical protein
MYCECSVGSTAHHLQELESYTGGVLHDRTGTKGLDHDVEITGWGETADGQKYPRST